MTEQHPITPPPELVSQWRSEPEYGTPGRVTLHTISEPRLFQLLTRSAQWGYDQRGDVNDAELQEARDQELEACCEEMKSLPSPLGIPFGEMASNALRTARRPKPPSLKRVALLQLDTLNADLGLGGKGVDLSQIRRALKRLKQLEDSND